MLILPLREVCHLGRPIGASCDIPVSRHGRRSMLRHATRKINDKIPVVFIDAAQNETYFMSRWGTSVPICRAQDFMTLSELAERLGIPPRQIRFMIAEGILPPASRTGRSADGYDEAHVEKGLRYLALHRLGMKPGSIKILMAFDDAVPVLQANGVEVRVDPTIPPSDLDVDSVVAAVRAALVAYTGKD